MVRLSNGTAENNGVAQVFYKDAWIKVCPIRMDSATEMSNVVCKQMGYRGAEEIQKSQQLKD